MPERMACWRLAALLGWVQGIFSGRHKRAAAICLRRYWRLCPPFFGQVPCGGPTRRMVDGV